MNFVISRELLEKVVSYVAKKPYAEVCNLIKQLSGLKQVMVEDEDKE